MSSSYGIQLMVSAQERTTVNGVLINNKPVNRWHIKTIDKDIKYFSRETQLPAIHFNLGESYVESWIYVHEKQRDADWDHLMSAFVIWKGKKLPEEELNPPPPPAPTPESLTTSGTPASTLFRGGFDWNDEDPLSEGEKDQIQDANKPTTLEEAIDEFTNPKK